MKPVDVSADLSPWWQSVRLGALLIILLDFGSALAWRGTTALSMVYPELLRLHVGEQTTNIIIKIVCSGGLVVATRLLTKPLPTKQSVSRLGPWVRGGAVALLVVQLGRLAFSLVGHANLVGWLEATTYLVNGLTVTLAAFYVATLLEEFRIAAPLFGARALGVNYSATSLLAAAVSATLWLPPYSSYRFIFPRGTRDVVTLLFCAVALAAVPLLLRMWRATPRIDDPPVG